MILEAIAVKAVATKLLAVHAANAAAGATTAHGLGGLAAVHATELGVAKSVGAATAHGAASHLATTEAVVAAKTHVTPLEAAGKWAFAHYRYFAVPTAGAAGVAGVAGAKAVGAKKLGKELVHKASQKVLQHDLELIRQRAEARALELERTSKSGKELTTRQRAELEALRRLEPVLRLGGPSLAAALAPSVP